MILEQNSKYIIKVCERDEIASVMDFFAREWDSKHLLASDLSFVDNHFYNGSCYNILIAKDTPGNVIALLNFVPSTFFDATIKPEEAFFWLTNWLVSKNTHSGVGLKLINALYKLCGSKSIGTTGNNDQAADLYRALKYKTGSLQQFFIVNNSVKNYKLISSYVPKAYSESIASTNEPVRIEIKDITNEQISEIESTLIFPHKTFNYVANKYGRNKYYKYYFCTVSRGDRLRGLIVYKIDKHGGSSALRIVDYIGDVSALGGLCFQSLLSEHGCEYADFYCYGIPEDTLYSSGFELNDGSSGLIVPNYYEPFLSTNIVINFAYNTKSEGILIFKGDGDREHPRIVSDF